MAWANGFFCTEFGERSEGVLEKDSVRSIGLSTLEPGEVEESGSVVRIGAHATTR